jgi:hypothetical protein
MLHDCARYDQATHYPPPPPPPSPYCILPQPVQVELYCDEALDSFAPRASFPSLPRSNSATDFYHPAFSTSPLPRSASAEPLRHAHGCASPYLESPARKRASPCPSSSPLHHRSAAATSILSADDDMCFLLSSESELLEPLLSVPHRPLHEVAPLRPSLVSNMFSVAAAYNADACIPFQGTSPPRTLAPFHV